MEPLFGIEPKFLPYQGNFLPLEESGAFLYGDVGETRTHILRFRRSPSYPIRRRRRFLLWSHKKDSNFSLRVTKPRFFLLNYYGVSSLKGIKLKEHFIFGCGRKILTFRSPDYESGETTFLHFRSIVLVLLGRFELPSLLYQSRILTIEL